MRVGMGEQEGGFMCRCGLQEFLQLSPVRENIHKFTGNAIRLHFCNYLYRCFTVGI